MQRWGTLWRPIAYSLHKVAKIVKVCAMLHNICVDRFNHLRSYVNNRRIWPDVPDQIAVDDLMPADDAIISRLHTNYVTQK